MAIKGTRRDLSQEKVVGVFLTEASDDAMTCDSKV